MLFTSKSRFVSGVENQVLFELFLLKMNPREATEKFLWHFVSQPQMAAAELVATLRYNLLYTKGAEFTFILAKMRSESLSKSSCQPIF